MGSEFNPKLSVPIFALIDDTNVKGVLVEEDSRVGWVIMIFNAVFSTGNVNM